jgi:hypothetical protein
MRYEAPELLIVGSASSLVLATGARSLEPSCIVDNSAQKESDEPELW